MKQILVGYDGSEAAHKALRIAKAHARGFRAKVHLLHCMAAGSDDRLDALESAEKDLEKARQFLAAEKIPVETHLHLVVSGKTPGEELVQFGEKLGVDEIILGVQKKSRLNKLIFGSTVQHVLLKAPWCTQQRQSE